jgi:hypothetical protein
MLQSTPGQTRISNTQLFIDEINELIHHNLDKQWMASEWNRIDRGEDQRNVHPVVCVAYKAHAQIQSLVESGTSGITPEIWQLAELAIKINALKKSNVPGIDDRLTRLTSKDFNLYRTVRYEIQIAGMLLQRGHRVEFIKECEIKTPDILTHYDGCQCEIECKHKEPSEDQIDYIKSIYNNTQTARKQFTKTIPGIICVEIDKPRFDEYEVERKRLIGEMERAMRNSSSISAIFLTSIVDIEDDDDFVYRHRVSGMLSKYARHILPSSLLGNLVTI